MDTATKNIGGGLKELPKDERDFSFGAIFGSVPLSELPAEYEVRKPLAIKQQEDSDLCTAFAACAVSEDQEGIELGPEYLFAKTKKIEGDWKTWGADLRSVCKAITKFGTLSKIETIWKLEDKGRDWVADWSNWPETLDGVAGQFRKKSYFSVTGPYDAFDNIRSAMWINREEERSVLTGCMWEFDWTLSPKGIIPEEAGRDSFGHAFKIFGWKRINGTVYLKAQLSNGEEIGDKGIFYFPRNVVNRKFTFGSFTFQDISGEEAKVLLEKKWSIGKRILAKIIAVWRSIF